MPFAANQTEKELLQRVAQGDRDAYQIIYKIYFPLVRQYVSLFEPASDTLDELTQDVFVRLWLKRELLQKVETFKGYLFMVTRNVVFNFLRTQKLAQKFRNLDESSAAVAESNTENEVLLRQYYRIAQDAMERLSPGRRKILHMSLDEGLTLDEIAARLGISRSGVKKQLYAATAFVRQYLQEHGELSVLLFVFLSVFENSGA